MHHRPSGPPLSARVQGALTRWSQLVRAALRRALPARVGRLALGAVVTTIVVGLVLAIPVVSGVGSPTPSMALDASSSTSPASGGPEGSPVVMGVDGAPAPSAAFAGLHTSATVSSTAPATAARGDDAATVPPAPVAVAAPATTGSAPAGPTASGGTADVGGTTSSSGTTGTGRATTDPSSPATSRAGSPSSTADAPGTGTTSAGTSGPVALPAEPSGAPAGEPTAGSEPASEVVALVGAERRAAGCDAGIADAELAAAAEAHSATMSATGALGVDGLDLAGRGVAAVVAHGPPDARSAVAGWLTDPADRTVLLDCSRTAIGVGVVDGWWTAVLA